MNLHALAAKLMLDAQTDPGDLDLDQVKLLPDALARPVLEEAVKQLKTYVPD